MDEWLGMNFVGYPVTNILDLDPELGHHDLQSYTVLKLIILSLYYFYICRIIKDNQHVAVGIVNAGVLLLMLFHWLVSCIEQSLSCP